MDIASGKEAIYQAFERKWGHPISSKARAEAEGRVGGVYDEEGLTNLRGYLDDIDPILMDVVAKSYVPRPESQSLLPKKRYKKALERRLHMVKFVVDRKQGRRIDWQPMCEEWNEQRPDETMTPDVFNAEYHRAKNDSDVQREYAKRFKPEFADLVDEVASRVTSEIDDPEIRDDMWAGVGKILLFGTPISAASTVLFTAANVSDPAFRKEQPGYVQYGPDGTITVSGSLEPPAEVDFSDGDVDSPALNPSVEE